MGFLAAGPGISAPTIRTVQFRPSDAFAGGLDDFVDRVAPLLQERGSFRTEYEGMTLREHLGLPQPLWKA
ncbi:hypothetical protein QMK19_15665 [Streptomyces sp. H10-C2]|uniref:hypothetical protein n=1 Tax=unclassified Streptomyces TaxID=2593676 RepID=UPI0024B8E404|nr:MULTISPECIES: hypothetical protein [unclassified Streptomyces]MDJ0343142.1 hypothetical protein [Streptomyces sp. PH10-H1]MDJ0371084.1 hypothetical protein [Streptomyces sp. H10-C2]